MEELLSTIKTLKQSIPRLTLDELKQLLAVETDNKARTQAISLLEAAIKREEQTAPLSPPPPPPPDAPSSPPVAEGTAPDAEEGAQESAGEGAEGAEASTEAEMPPPVENDDGDGELLIPCMNRFTGGRMELTHESLQGGRVWGWEAVTT